MIALQNIDCRNYDWQNVDCLITDPPYREHVHNAAVSQSKVRGARKRDLGFAHLSDELRLFTCQLAAKTKRWVVIFSDVESIGAWAQGLEDAGAHYIRAIPWVRFSMPQLSGDRPIQGSEMVIVGYGYGKGKKHWNGLGNFTHFDHKCLRGEDKHKAEKPLDLMLDIVEWFSDVGETVADPFMGSGTTGLACSILRRNFIATEEDTTWWGRSSSRLFLYGTDGSFSERDRDRYNRYLERHKIFESELARTKKHTAKIRAKNESL